MHSDTPRTPPAPPAGIRVRPAHARDLDAVIDIERDSFADPSWSRDTFRGLLTAPRTRFVVACATTADAGGGDAATIGYIVLSHVVDEAEIANLAVAPEWRGRGVGGHLVDVAIEAAAASGVRSLFLEVRESNTAAQRLYRSRDFVVVGRRPGYYRRPAEDALLLQRRI
jgi:ribosomal-protein-alanine N-acetyltransferase